MNGWWTFLALAFLIIGSIVLIGETISEAEKKAQRRYGRDRT